MMSEKCLILFMTIVLWTIAGCVPSTNDVRDQTVDKSASPSMAETCDYVRQFMGQFGLALEGSSDDHVCHVEGAAPLAGFDAEIDPLESLKESLIERGWSEVIEFSADGPGSSSYRVEKDQLYCQVEGGAPAWLDDDGEIRQSEEFFMKADCNVER